MTDSELKSSDFSIDIEKLVKEGRAKFEVIEELDCDLKIFVGKKFWEEISGTSTGENKEDENIDKKCVKCKEIHEPTLCALENTLRIYKFCKWTESKTCKKFIRDEDGDHYCSPCLDEMENPPCYCYGEREFYCDESCYEELNKFFKEHSLCDCYEKATNEKVVT